MDNVKYLIVFLNTGAVTNDSNDGMAGRKNNYNIDQITDNLE